MDNLIPISSLYLHYPFCRHLCNYCDFFRTKNESPERHQEFHHYLDQSFKKLKALLLSEKATLGPLETLYLGGGTPSLWGEIGVEYLSSLDLKFQKGCEITLEVNPGSWTEEGISAFKNYGVNRYSIGVQTLSRDLQKHLDRVHSIDEARETIQFFKGENFSVDLLLGSPYSENSRDVIEELEELLSYNPSHLSLYILTVKDRYLHAKNLPSEEWIEREYLSVSKYLQERGFIHYEVSNFAKSGFLSQHNLKYWKNESVAALGPSATGIIRSGDRALRFKWENSAPEFKSELLGKKELDLEDLYLKLRTNQGASLDLDEVLLKRWNDSGYLLSNSPIILSAKGYLMLDSLMNDLFYSK